jgi:hypothetical protein
MKNHLHTKPKQCRRRRRRRRSIDDVLLPSASVRYPSSRYKTVTQSTPAAGGTFSKDLLLHQFRNRFYLSSKSHGPLVLTSDLEQQIETAAWRATGTGNRTECVKASLFIRAAPAPMQNYLPTVEPLYKNTLYKNTLTKPLYSYVIRGSQKIFY